MALNRFAVFAWGTLGYNLLVILWGAFVRATGSGAGCGDHWPLCNGQVVPRPEQVETLIEFTHRLTSGVALLAVVVMLIWAYRAYPKGHIVRTGARISMILMLIEALVGAGLVLFRLVADNQSVYRAVAMAIHQANTLLLIGAIGLTAWWASGGAAVQVRQRGGLPWALGFALLGVLVISSTGAITALGDTLFPIKPGTNGLERAMDDTAHFLEQLRVFHPAIAVLLSVYVTGLSWYISKRTQSPTTDLLAWCFSGLFLAQLIFGAINVALFAPVWMQLVHLLMADLVWLALIFLTAAALAKPATEEVLQPVPVAVSAVSGD
jgi:heme A synthase